MKVITVSNQKGGVAKSTTTMAIATGLHYSKYRVLAIDLDAQGNLSHTLKAGMNASSILEVLMKSTEVSAAIQKTSTCDIIPSSRNLGSADLIINQTGKEYRLRESLSQLKDQYDYVVIDTPPALGILTINALTACDDIIIPAQADMYSMQGITQVIESVKTVRQYCNQNIRIAGILLTRFNAQTILSREIAEQLEKAALQFGTKVFKTRIRESIAIKEAQAKRQNMYEYDIESIGTKDYLNFFKEYFGEKNE
jgi:chromosome partitioning protein